MNNRFPDVSSFTAAFPGTDGNDVIRGDLTDDYIRGGAGGDRLFGGQGDDIILGQEGNDRLFGDEGGDRLLGLGGKDRVNGGSGNDNVRGGHGRDRLKGGDGDDQIVGGQGNDSLFGQRGNDLISGNQGDDLLKGGRGDDELRGSPGSDQVLGGAGNDRLYGGQDDDTLDGGSGDDVLQGGQGNDRLIGNAGHDVFILAPGKGSDIIEDFEVGVDAIGLGGGLTVDALSISQSGTDMLIRITATGDVLATMLNVFITPIQISAMDDRASGIEGGTITTLENGASSLLANDGSMAEQDSITIVARGDRTTILTEVKASGTENRFTVVTTPVTAPQFGTLSLNTDGTFIYTHDGSQNFADSFTYSVASPEGQTDTATVFLTITAVNDSPVLTSAATVNAAENQIAALDVQSTDDNDSEGAGIIYSITGGPDQAFLTIDSTTGLVTFNTAPDFENPLDAGADNVYDIQVTATDSGSLTNRQNIAITVTDVVETPSGTLFISEYIEGSSFNKALEFHNNSGTIITLDNYTLERYANGSASASQTVNLGTVTGQATLANGETIVLYNSSASAGLITAAGTATIAAPSSIVIHNGNDAYALKESGTIIDLFGTIGQDPGNAWTENSHSTKDQTLQRKLSIAQGNSTGFSVGDTSALENEWDSLAQDTFSGLGSFVVP